MSLAPQPALLGEVPLAARYLTWRIAPGTNRAGVLEALESLPIDAQIVVGLGAQLVSFCEAQVPGLRDAPALHGPGVASPSTPTALWMWLLGSDRGELLHRTRTLALLLEEAFELIDVTEAFRYAEGRDLSGYVDGTENPEGDAAHRTAVATQAGIAGSSFVAVQQWVHDLDALAALSPRERDAIVGRRLSDNEEMDDAPPSAHVKRTAQESFDPEAFVLRRSMPWSDPTGEGLVFVAFGKSFDAFETLLRHMLGLDDGIVDALLRFTTPISSAYYWCPPVVDGQLDLTALERR